MVPSSLRVWFVIHFALDLLFAVPLLVAPQLMLAFFGWRTIDPLASRLVGAALMGIGGESFLGRNGGAEVYRAMLNLKIIWSLTAAIGIGLSLSAGGPAWGWGVLGIFGAFCILWIYYRIRLGHSEG